MYFPNRGHEQLQSGFPIHYGQLLVQNVLTIIKSIQSKGTLAQEINIC